MPSAIGLLLAILCIGCAEAQMFHQEPVRDWVQSVPEGFDELVLSWNAERPIDGFYQFYIAVQVDKRWSPLLLYATWQANNQYGNKYDPQGFPAMINEDCLTILKGRKGQAFRVVVKAEEGADINRLKALHVCASTLSRLQSKAFDLLAEPIHLAVPALSQMTQPMEVRSRICSPTSMTAVIRYLLGNDALQILDFASGCHDHVFAIYGNWVLNVANAYVKLGAHWRTWVERLDGFDAVYRQLQQGIPVVVSVKGPLIGGALSYHGGHLLVVTGYDPVTQEVLCMDPAFPSNEETFHRYPYHDFIEAWGRRHYVSYQFARA